MRRIFAIWMLLLVALALTACGGSGSGGKVDTDDNAALVLQSDLSRFLDREGHDMIFEIPQAPWLLVRKNDKDEWRVIGCSLEELNAETLSQVRTFIRCDNFTWYQDYRSTYGSTTTGTSQYVEMQVFDAVNDRWYGEIIIEHKQLPKTAGSTPHYTISDSTVRKNIEKRYEMGISVMDVPEDFDISGTVLKDYHDSRYSKDEPYRTYNTRSRSQPMLIPSSVTTIGANAFSATRFSGYVLGDSVTELESRAFSACSEMEEIDLSHVRKIGNNAFSGCTELETLELSDSEELLENIATCFVGCSALREVNVSPDNPALMSRNGVVYSKDGKTLLYYPENSLVSFTEAMEGVEALGDYAFRYAHADMGDVLVLDTLKRAGDEVFYKNETITEVTLGGELTEIAGAFQKCPRLEKVTITAPLTTLGKYCFDDCENLREVTLPDTLKEIEYSFSECHSMQEIRIPPSVEKIAYPAFNHIRMVVTPGSYAEEYAKEHNFDYRCK